MPLEEKCKSCGRTDHPLADNGLCWECWLEEMDKAVIQASGKIDLSLKGDNPCH